MQDLFSNREPDPLVEVDVEGKGEKELRMYDADTLMGDGESYRIKGLDAPEMPSLEFPMGLTGGVGAEEYRDETKNLIESGFNNLKFSDEEEHYGRNLVKVEDDLGRDLAYEATKSGLYRPSKYELDSDILQDAWTSSRFDALVGAEADLPAWKQIENTIYRNSEPRLGQLTWLEQAMLPSSLKPVNKAIDDSFSGQAIDAVEMWWYQNKGAWEGLKALVGDESGFQGMEDVQSEISENIKPTTILDLRQIEDTSDVFAFIQNNLIMHGPDFAVLYGSGKAGAVAGTAVAGPAGTLVGGVLGSLAGLGYMFGKTTGNVAQEQYEVTDEVDFAQAVTLGVAITAVDKLGATKVINPKDILSKEGIKNATVGYKNHLASQGVNITNQEARKKITNTINKEVSNLANDISLKTTDLITKRQLALNTGLSILKGAGKEALTEATQESIQYLGINGMPQEAKEWEEFGWRLANSAAAGGVVGGTFHTGSSLLERNKIENLRSNISEYDSDTSGFSTKLSVEGNKDFDYKPIEEVVNDYKDTPLTTLEERKERLNKGYGRRALDKIVDLNYIPGLSAIKNAIRPFLINKKTGLVNKEALLIANIEGAYQTMSGNTLYNEEQLRLSNISTSFDWLTAPQQVLGLSNKEVSDILDTLVVDNFSVKNIPEDKIEIANKLKTDLLSLRRVIKDLYDRAGVNPESYRQTNIQTDVAFLLDKGLPDTTKVSQNSQKFINDLSGHVLTVDFGDKKAGEKVGEELATNILKNLFGNDLLAVSKDLRDLNAKEALKDFYPTDMLEVLKNKTMAEVVYATRHQYRGENNAVLANAINKLEADGVLTQEQADALASDLVDQIDKHAGQFGRLKNEKLAQAQDVARTITSVGLMDFVIFAQAGEMVLTFMSSNQGITKSIGQLAKNFAKAFWHTLPSIITKRKISETSKDYKNLGYNTDELLQQYGANIDTKTTALVQKYFYKINLLEQTTDSMRMSRMNIALSSIDQMIGEFIGVDLTKMNKHQAMLYERLSFYGADVPGLVKIYNKTSSLDPEVTQDKLSDVEQDFLFKQWSIILPKFIDEFTARIKPGARPSIFEEQRYGLPFFTQYLSFTANFHSNVLPRLYNVYIKDATAPIAFNTFMVIAGTILAAYISQFLKDLLIRGELNPYLDETTGAVQRAITYSGAVGWNTELAEITIGGPYMFKTDGIIDYLAGTPTFSHLGKVAGNIYEGDYEKAAQRAIPFGDLSKDTAAPARILEYLKGEE